MNNLKKEKLIYKHLMTYLVINEEKKKKWSNFRTSYKSIKFEIKLYLIALSFNRFIFNFDKILFVLCIITNFLYFLAFKKPRVLFFGEYNTTYAGLYKRAAEACDQLYYDKSILPGSITNIDPVNAYYEKAGKETFTKHLDCIISFFCNPIEQELLEARSLCIPIIGLIELKAKNIDAITYPLICIKDLKTLYFFSNYFAKILNSSNIDLKEQFYKIKKYKKKDNTLVRHYSTKTTNNIVNKNFILHPNLIINNLFLINACSFYFFFNSTFCILKDMGEFSNSLDWPTKKTSKIMVKIHSTSINNLELPNRKIKISTEVFRKRILSIFKKFNQRAYPIWYRKKQKIKQQYKLKYKFNRKKKPFWVFFKNLRNKQKTNKKDYLLKKITKLEQKIPSDFNLKNWANELRNFLKVKNIYGNRSLTARDKKFFLREYIITNLKTFNVTTGYLRLRNQIITTNYPYIEKYAKKVFETKAYKPTLARDIIGSWEYRKWKLFTVTEIPKKKKRIKRLKLFWKLHWLIKLQKPGSIKKYIYTKRVRSTILKKKILMKKLIEYYYAFSYGRKVKSLIVFSNKEKNKSTIVSGKNLMNVFESHLSIFVLRCKLASNMLDCKSLITRGKILVNGKVVYNPGYILNSTDIVQLKSIEIAAFYNKFIKINKPSRWKKNRFFYRLSMRNPISKGVLRKTINTRRSKARVKNMFICFKYYWKLRKFSFITFTKFFINLLGQNSKLKRFISYI